MDSMVLEHPSSPPTKMRYGSADYIVKFYLICHVIVIIILFPMHSLSFFNTFINILFQQIVYPIGGHLASTYCALAILKMVGYDLSIINSEALLISMRRLQQHDGR